MANPSLLMLPVLGLLGSPPLPPPMTGLPPLGVIFIGAALLIILLLLLGEPPIGCCLEVALTGGEAVDESTFSQSSKSS